MGIVIGAKPESSFADPLGLLSDCHRRIEKFLQTLLGIVAQVQGGTLRDEHRQALETALRYFREAAPRHTCDEEESLFPKMRAAASPEVQAALAAIDSLETDHDRADAGHAEVELLGRKWLAEGGLIGSETARLEEVLQSLQSLYQRHIGIEDTQIFPLAGKVLDAETIERIGREMAARRGINLDTLPDLKLRCPTRQGN